MNSRSPVGASARAGRRREKRGRSGIHSPGSCTLSGILTQPLHASARFTTDDPDGDGDDGGNGVELTPSSNLHSFWDGVLATATKQPLRWPRPPCFPLLTQTRRMIWMWRTRLLESFNLAKADVYKEPSIREVVQARSR